jgi:hypothetical protein
LDFHHSSAKQFVSVISVEQNILDANLLRPTRGAIISRRRQRAPHVHKNFLIIGHLAAQVEREMPPPSAGNFIYQWKDHPFLLAHQNSLLLFMSLCIEIDAETRLLLLQENGNQRPINYFYSALCELQLPLSLA